MKTKKKLNQKNVAECVFDITTVACTILGDSSGIIILGTLDSRYLFNEIYGWAQEFEGDHAECNDYMTEIEEFAYTKLKEYFELEAADNDKE